MAFQEETMIKKIEKIIRQKNGVKGYLPLFIGILSFLAVFAGCMTYIRQAAEPLDSFEISPASDPARWQFTLTDGTALEPKDGRLPIEGEDTVVICETFLAEGMKETPLLVVNANASDCVFFLDGQPIYMPSGRYGDGGFSADVHEFTGASGQFVLRMTEDRQRLTMIVQFQGEENRLSRMPKLTLYPEILNFLSQYTGVVSTEVLSAGFYFAAALFLAGVYLIGLWKQRSNPDLLFLIICALSMAFSRTAAYSYGVIKLFWVPTIIWFCTVLPQVSISWMLWYHLSPKRRLSALPLLGLVTALLLVIFAVGFKHLSFVQWMGAMSMWILPALLFVTFLIAVVDAAGGNPWFRRFFSYFVGAVPAAGLAWLFSALTGGRLAQSMQNAISGLTASNHSFHFLADQVCIFLLILCFIQAIWELIDGLAKQDARMQVMSLREKYAVDNMEIMRQSQEETRRQRHELRHHMVVLEEMLSQNQEKRARDYIRKMASDISAIPTETYSEHMVINAIAGHYLNMAKSEGIRVETDIRTRGKTPLEDGEISVLLTNLLENALEGSGAAKDNQEKFISLVISSDQEKMLITCENNTDVQIMMASDGTIPSSKPDAKKHGYGIPAMRRIVEKHHGNLSIICEDKHFLVKVIL